MSIQTSIEAFAREQLVGSRLFPPVRSLYQLFFNGRKRLFWKNMRALYTPFVSAGDLVFDIGANRGTYAQIFLGLGARVVSVEPNDLCCAELRRIAKSFGGLIVVEKAVGEKIGTATFHVCEDSTISTLSEQWFRTAQTSSYHQAARWVGERKVEVTTLDQLAEQYGVPKFIKVDVEGLDDEVLRGMSFAPPALSFEFNTTIINVALACLEIPRIRDNYDFNIDCGLDPHFQLPRWVCADEVKDLLLQQTCESGDVVARRR